MIFWAYMLHCRGGAYYTGHTNDLEHRVAQHQIGSIPGFTADLLPVELVWSQEFSSRLEALAAERQIKGWSRAKKMALIRGDWDAVSALAKKKGGPSTSSGRTGEERAVLPRMVRPERLSLLCHPDTPGRSIYAIWATVLRTELGACFVTFRAIGDTSSISWPVEETSGADDWAKADELWRHNCFEIFGRIGGQESYIEINLSPAKKWASYWFSSYRTDMTGIDNIRLANSIVTVRESHAELSARLVLPLEYADQDIELALSAVIEEKDGTKSYWALRHPPGKPDFHHPDCFAQLLPAPA